MIVQLDIGSAVVRRAERSGQRVIVAKAYAGLAPSVVWLVHPARERLTLRFRDVYGVYYGRAPGRPGERIEPLAVVYPARGRAYVASAGGFRRIDGARRLPLGHYGMCNDGEVPLAGGLVQVAHIAEARVLAPITMAVLAPGRAAEFVLVRDVLIWLAGEVAPGLVLSTIPGQALRLADNRGHMRW
jgi:hypothetical protein